MLTPNFVILISSGVSLISLSSGAVVLWPPPNLVAGLCLFLMAMMSVPIGFLLRALTHQIVAIERSRLSPRRKRQELDRLSSSIFGVVDRMVAASKRLVGGDHERDG